MRGGAGARREVDQGGRSARSARAISGKARARGQVGPVPLAGQFGAQGSRFVSSRRAVQPRGSLRERVQGRSVRVPGRSKRTLEGESGQRSGVKGIPGKGLVPNSCPGGRCWRGGWQPGAERVVSGSFSPAGARAEGAFRAGDLRPVGVVITVPWQPGSALKTTW